MRRGFATWLVLAASAGCGTLVHGTRPTLRLDVDPPGTEVSVYRWSGVRVAGPARSPGELVVPRTQEHEPYVVVASAPGHCPRYWVADVAITPAARLGPWLAFPPFGATPVETFDRSTGGCCAIVRGVLGGRLLAESQCPE